jgi:type II secretory pathway component PulM
MTRLVLVLLLFATPALAQQAGPPTAQQQQAAIDAVTSRILRDVSSLSTALAQATAQIAELEKAKPAAPAPEPAKP